MFMIELACCVFLYHWLEQMAFLSIGNDFHTCPAVTAQARHVCLGQSAMEHLLCSVCLIADF